MVREFNFRLSLIRGCMALQSVLPAVSCNLLEKSFQIICRLDELRDAMREVLQDVQTYPKKVKGDTLTIKDTNG